MIVGGINDWKMSLMTVLLTQIRQVLIDLKSEKITVRSKCLDEFHNILDNRSRDLLVFLRSSHNNRTDDDDHEVLTWSDLFSGLHDAIKDQCARLDASNRSQTMLKSLIAKNDGYKGALRKCINLANEDGPNVSYTKICHAAFECFDTPAMNAYFDDLYMQIVRKHILNAKHSLSELKITDWSRKCHKMHIILCKNYIHIPSFFAIFNFIYSSTLSLTTTIRSKSNSKNRFAPMHSIDHTKWFEISVYGERFTSIFTKCHSDR